MEGHQVFMQSEEAIQNPSGTEEGPAVTEQQLGGPAPSNSAEYAAMFVKKRGPGSESKKLKKSGKNLSKKKKRKREGKKPEGGEEVAGEEVKETDDETGEAKGIKKEKAFSDTLRTFNRAWLEDPLFREWLRYDQRRNRMFCRICERNEKNDRNQFSSDGSVNFRVSALKDHLKSRGHMEAAKIPPTHGFIPRRSPLVRGWDQAVTFVTLVEWMSKEEIPLTKFKTLCELLMLNRCPTMPDSVDAVSEFMQNYLTEDEGGNIALIPRNIIHKRWQGALEIDNGEEGMGMQDGELVDVLEGVEENLQNHQLLQSHIPEHVSAMQHQQHEHQQMDL